MGTELAIDLREQREAPTAPTPGTELAVTGMTCGNCARHVTEAIQSVPGVHSATVRLEANQATVRWTTGAEQNVPALIHAVEEAGYGASVSAASAHGPGEHKPRAWHLNLWVGLLGTVPLMFGEWVLGLSMTSWFQWGSL